jgi:hypothetical protein
MLVPHAASSGAATTMLAVAFAVIFFLPGISMFFP